MAEKGLASSITDAGVGGWMARAGFHGAIYNVKINLGSITDTKWVAEVRSRLDQLERECVSVADELHRLVEEGIEK